MFLSNFTELHQGDRGTGANLFLPKHFKFNTSQTTLENKDIHGSIILGTTQSQYPEYDRRNKPSLSSLESKRKEN